VTWAGTTASTLAADDLARARAALEAAEVSERKSAASLRTSGEAERVAGQQLTAATLADDRARTDQATLSTRTAERRQWLTGRSTAAEAERLAEEHRRLDGLATSSRTRSQEAAAVRARTETVRDQRRTEQQDARATLLRVRDGFAGLGAPALDADELPRAWAALAAWAGEQTDRRRAALASATADLERLDTELDRGSAALAALLDEHRVERPGDALPTEPTGPDAPTRWARIPTLVELQLERARAATAAVVQRRAAAVRLQTTIATDTETETVSRTLQQLMSAKRFPQWLADAALDTLVADASASLLQLSGGQFELTHERGEFFVVDHADADSSRSVKTLSGGETFQASLALALALSEQLATLAAGGRTTLDSIFLDEGFGTLDPDALEIVAGTLENLAQGNRMVGVVTHVAALADRVPVRFEVSRDSRTSTIERVGP
jgi:exonuclease SbcC